MALSQTEKEALLELKGQGYSFTEAMSFVGGQRFNKPSKVSSDIQADQEPDPIEKDNFFKRTAKDIPSDLSEAFTGARDAVTGGIENADVARQQVTDQEISPIAGTLKTIGGGLRAGAEVVGEAVKGVGKLFTTPEAEESISSTVESATEAVVETQPVQSLIQSYEGLDPETKAIVDGALGTAEGLSVTLGATPAVNAVKASVGGVGKLAKTGYESIDIRLPDLQGIELPSTSGISQAVDLGLKPEDLMQRVARISKGKQAKFEERAGQSIGTYLVERDIFGTPDQIVDQLYKRLSDSKGRVDESLLGVKGRFKADQVSTALTELLERDTKVSTQGSLAPDSKRITELYQKYSQGGLELSEVNEVKRLYERNVRVDYMNFGNPNATALAKATNVDSSLRKLVEDKATKAGVTTVRDLNKETSLAKQLMDDLGNEIAGSGGNNALGLTDTIFLAESLGNPIAALGFATKKVASSKKVMSAVAKLASKDTGVKADLPAVEKPDAPKLSGYAEFLNRSN